MSDPMPLKQFYRISMLIIACILTISVYSQCLIAPPPPVSTGTETLAIDGETLNTGTTKWLYGAPALFGNYTLNGGTLNVCGNLTIDKLIFNTGTIFVSPGSVFVIGSGIGTTLQLQGGCYVYNYGTITAHRGIALDNAHVSAANPNIFINASAASLFDMTFDWLVINNPFSWFVNNGNAIFHGIVTDPLSSAGSVCLGSSSSTYQTVLVNNAKNAYATPSGSACMSVNEHSYLCDQVTTAPGLNACLGTTHVTDSSCMVSKGMHTPWGSATLAKNCNTCVGLVLLNNYFVFFSAEKTGNASVLNWQMANEPPSARYIVERSRDGHDFTIIDSFAASAAWGTTYAFRDTHPLPELNYYRVGCRDLFSGKTTFGPVQQVRQDNPALLSLYPNPFYDRFFITLPYPAKEAGVTITDFAGKMVSSAHYSRTGNDAIEITSCAALPPGIYLVKITTVGNCYVQKVIKR